MDHLSPRSPRLDFNLQSMELIYDQAQGQADEPHRHDYYTLLLVEQAEGQHAVDYQTYPFARQEVHFVSPGQVHQVEVWKRPKGWVITFSKDFLVENNIPERFISNLNLFRPFGENPPLALDQITFDRLRRIIQEMLDCMPTDLIYRTRALGALLQLFLIYCNNTLTLDTQQLDEEDAGVCILRDFKGLLEKHYQDWHKVSDYASELFISPKHLSATIKTITGKTAKTFIQDRLTLEAKRLLLHTDLSVKEIAYRMGFEEPLHFSGFFKKQTGISPSDYREQK